jgi:hypothetical protein
VNPRPFIFAIPNRARIPYVLGGFLSLSLLIHLVTFYLFRVEYPPSVTIIPPPARVVVLQPDTPENRAFLQWIDASDPAMFAQPPMAPAPTEDLFAFEPSYKSRPNEPILLNPIFKHPTATYPPAIDGVALSMRMKTSGESVAPSVSPMPSTKIVYDAAIGKRLSGNLPRPEFERTNAESLIPARFLIATPSIGEKPLVFLQTSSGDETLDQDAEGFLRHLPFTRGEVEWGFVTIFWGPEILAVPKSPENPS